MNRLQRRDFLKIWIFVIVTLSCVLVSPDLIRGAGAQMYRDPLAVLPHVVPGVENSRISLNGEWQFNMNPSEDFWTDLNEDSMDWTSIQVPGECRMQGFPIVHDKEYAYRTRLQIPDDFEGRTILIRFDGVYSYARVWIDGSYIRDHHGGFTSWDCDITEFVRKGKNHLWLYVGVTDRKDDISYGSGYAHHPIGGILRSVELAAVPNIHVRDLHVLTRFGPQYQNVFFQLSASLSSPAPAQIELWLRDPSGGDVPIHPSILDMSSNHLNGSVEIPIRFPKKWDAEHPNLYTLDARLIVEGRVQEEIRMRIGFREVKVVGNRLLVNGNEVKLRGANRHDIHPLLGRSTTPEQDELDVRLAKEANFNFIRTSHYPPSKEFLDNCDRFGLYVEEETAVCFVGTHRSEAYKETGATENDPDYLSRYLDQLAEMLDRDRNHPCVIIWSVGNENSYGVNFQSSFDMVKSLDTSRPIMFSYPGKVPQGNYCYDILSMHYVSHTGRVDQYGIKIDHFGSDTIPVLHDEWAHVPCYNIETLKSDPNVRNYWGESMKRMWDGCFSFEGALGGAIWGMIDEVFQLPDECVGYGQWGIVDVWRRKKPEFWHTKKSYSPVRILETFFTDIRLTEDLSVPVINRFDHTNLQELRIEYLQNGSRRSIIPPDVVPHSQGAIVIPSDYLENLDPIILRFFDGGNRLIDEYELTFDQAAHEGVEPIPPGIPPVFRETKGAVIFEGEDFLVVFDRESGLIDYADYQGTRIIEGGPFLNLVVPGKKEQWNDSKLVQEGLRWEPEKVDISQSDSVLRSFARGRVGKFRIVLDIRVDRTGRIRADYVLENPPEEIHTVGLSYSLSKDLNSLHWTRQPLWTTYPEDHIGRSDGTVSKFSPDPEREVYRIEPEQPWSLDTKDFYLFSLSGLPENGLPVTNDFRSMKENIFLYELTESLSGKGIRVESDGAAAARSAVNGDGSIDLSINNRWTYFHLDWGNYEREIKLSPGFSGTVVFKLFKR
ncbi:glycoside hydrolase family 2 protein [Acidobacteriota bacterium]